MALDPSLAFVASLALTSLAFVLASLVVEHPYFALEPADLHIVHTVDMTGLRVHRKKVHGIVSAPATVGSKPINGDDSSNISSFGTPGIIFDGRLYPSVGENPLGSGDI